MTVLEGGMTDQQLLQAIRQRRDERAFCTLVECYGEMIFSSAVRQCGDRAMAEDVTQAVFILLMKKTPAIRTGSSLAGWLLKATHFCVRDALKISRRRRAHETAAGRLRIAGAADGDPRWTALSPHVDAALAELGAKERGAIVLKYFQNQTLEEIGQSLGISKEGAHKRVKRGLNRLRQVLARRGVALPAAGVAGGLLARPADAAPQTLKLLIAKQALNAGWGTSSSAAKIAQGAWKMVIMAKLKTALTSVAAIAIVLLALWPLVHARAQARIPAPRPAAADTIMPGDTLCIGVSDLLPGQVETIKTVHVSSEGDVSLLYVGAVRVGGMDFAAAEKAIAEAYQGAQLVRRTSVSINRLAGGKAARPLRAGDRVSVRIFELAAPGEWINRVVPISEGGRVGLPFVGQVELAGMEEGPAEQAIARRYAGDMGVREPIVSVYRLEEDEAAEPTIEPITPPLRTRK
jgi:RNA polymerase sigma factor (sigma-70 family)